MPIIKSISIEHYRGFFKKRDIEFASATGVAGSGLTILVGPNNSGKTTVVSALRLLLSPKQVDVEERHEGHPLVISIVTDEGLIKTLTNPGLGAVVAIESENPNGWPSANDLRLVPARRSWNAYTGQQDMEAAHYWTTTLNTPGADNYLVSRVAKFTDAEKSDFDKLLKELIPQIDSWKVEMSRGQSFIEYKTKTGARHSADLFGDGMASLFRVALALMDSRDGYIVAIDEPELSLHPQAQKTLAGVIARYAKDRQIIITTHSPYLIRWADLSAGAKVYRLSQEKAGVSVGILKPSTIKKLNKLIADWQKPNLLDAVAREVFFADEVVFFEGQEDVGLLKNYAEKHQLPSIPAFGYGAGGAGNIKHFLNMAKDLNIAAVAVYDGDHADEKAAVEKEFPNVLVELLPMPDIRDKPKRNDKGKELNEIEKLGLFDRHGNLKPEHEDYLRGLLNRIEGRFGRPGA